jgi:3-oxoacyl-[acyl-carrier protein] reductase
MRLKGKNAVITGGTRGLGRAIARHFLAEGATVTCASRTAKGWEELHRDAPDRSFHLPVDVSDPASVEQLVTTAAELMGSIDILVANAAVRHDGRIERLAPEAWTETLTVSLTGVFLCTRAVVPVMAANGGGCIINISSGLATRVAVGTAAYSAAKAGVESFTRTSAIELGPKNIKVNCISPGLIDSGMSEALRPNVALWEMYTKRIAMGRAGHEDEIASTAVFLASDESSYVNGHVLEVNGGLLWA